MLSQHPAGASGASGPVPQHNGGNDQGCEDQQGDHAGMYCDEHLDHAGHNYNDVSHTQRHAAGGATADAEMVEAPVEHSARPHPDEGCFTCPQSAAEHSDPLQSAATHAAHPHSAAKHPANPCSAADQSAQSQVSGLHDQYSEDFHDFQASSACQQAEHTRAGPPVHHHDVDEPHRAPPAYPHHAEHNLVPQMVPEQLQASQPQQQQQQCRLNERPPHTEASAANLQPPQQQQMPAGRVQHDQVAEQVQSSVRSPASGSHLLASQQRDVQANSNAVQAESSEPGPFPSTTAAVQCPQQSYAVSLLDPALLAQLSRHAHPQGPDTAADAHCHSTNDVLRRESATPATSGGAVGGQQPTCATAVAQRTLSQDCHQSPQQQMQSEAAPLSAHDGSKQGQARTSPHASIHASPDTSTHAGPGNTHRTDASQLRSVQQLAEEHFEQDQMSQPSSSESDEDFQPSEYEQDEMSQPSSSSGDEETDEDEDDDAFEVDELSQPESSSEDDEQSPVRSESGVRVRSSGQARSPNTIAKSRREDVVRNHIKASKAQSPTTAASGRSGVKCSRQESLSADHKARLGFPKPAQPIKAVPVPQGYMRGSSLPVNSQSLPIDQLQRGLKSTVRDAAAQQGGRKRMRTTASAFDAQKAGARGAQRPDEEGCLQAPADQQVR